MKSIIHLTIILVSVCILQTTVNCKKHWPKVNKPNVSNEGAEASGETSSKAFSRLFHGNLTAMTKEELMDLIELLFEEKRNASNEESYEQTLSKESSELNEFLELNENFTVEPTKQELLHKIKDIYDELKQIWKGEGNGKSNDKGKDKGNGKDNGKGDDKGNNKGNGKGNDKGNGKGNGKGDDKGNGKGNGKDNGKGDDKGNGKDNGKGNDKGNGKGNGKDKGKG